MKKNLAIGSHFGIKRVKGAKTGVAGNMVRPARLSDRTRLPRLKCPDGHLRLGRIVRVQAIWSGQL